MWHQAQTGKGNKKMKGLAITILLAVLELSAVSRTGGSLLSDGSEQVTSIRREETGLQSEMLVDAERPDVELEPGAAAANLILKREGRQT